MFFHPDHERGPAKDGRDLRAKQVCAHCPVIEACRKHALDVHEPYGVWGGMTVDERAAIPSVQPARSGLTAASTTKQEDQTRRIEWARGVPDRSSEIQQSIEDTLATIKRLVEHQSLAS